MRILEEEEEESVIRDTTNWKPTSYLVWSRLQFLALRTTDLFSTAFGP